jgi:MoxR-like ATPase
MLAEPVAQGRRSSHRRSGPHASSVEIEMNLDAYRIASEPFYQPVRDEIAVFEAAFSERLPVMLKGPTGCGKTAR